MAHGGTPLGFSAPSLETSYQAQIDDLVQRNRTLEHTKQKLAEQVAHESSRSKEAIGALQKQWQVEQAEWRDGCDVLQSCHRVVQLQNVVEIEKERINVLKELDAARKEKLLRLQRDFRITMFQAREAELEERIRELEEASDAKDAAIEESARRLKTRNAQLIAQAQAKDQELAVADEQKEELNGRLAGLQLQFTRLQADADKLATSLERTTLQCESAVTTRDGLKHTNEELKRSNADMLRQIDKWQTLENKGDAEAEAQRKKRIELEVQAKDLQSQLEKVAEEHEKSVEKEKRKVEKLKTGIQEWQAESEKYEQESEDAQKRLAKAEKQIAKLKDALELERSRARPPSPEMQHALSPPIPVDASEDEEVAQPSPPSEPPVKHKAQTKAPAKAKVAELVNGEAGPSDTTTEGTMKPTAKKRKPKVAAADSDIEEILPAEKSKQKPRSKPKASPVPKQPDGDVEEVPPQKPKPKSKGKGKAKAVDELAPENEVEIVGADRGKKRKAGADADGEVVAAQKPIRKRQSKRAGSELRDAGTKARKAGNAVESDTEEKEPPAKKKRKINIFPTNVKPTAFNFMPDIDGGLNIPTVLSPVKDTDAVPIRSTSGSVIGSIGSMLRNSFTRR
ncbi:hypothetical protein DXG03_002534 [Asterophora parasitica]|uniref:Uncharacterized protein n=1 Tax=Asterophora parasitica TaxID=117018 RepID=A0A9P7K9S7_9AGAR|nr:hypothetical protein DXG03_002534 [Asterophora parasitica]